MSNPSTIIRKSDFSETGLEMVWNHLVTQCIHDGLMEYNVDQEEIEMTISVSEVD